jgi:hypothetical protein
MTSERLAKVPFTTPMHVQALELFVPQAEEVDPPLYRMVGAVFRPFHVSVWCLIACLAIFVGLLDMWLNKKIWIGKIDAARERGGAYATPPRRRCPPRGSCWSYDAFRETPTIYTFFGIELYRY